MKRYGIIVCTSISALLYSMEMEMGYRPEVYEAPSASAKEAILSPGRAELERAYEQQALERAQAQGRELERYDMPTREEAESAPEAGESYWDRMARREEEESRMRRMRAEERAEEFGRPYRQMPPERVDIEREKAATSKARIEEYQAAYRRGELRPPRFEREYPEPGYVRARKRIEQENPKELPKRPYFSRGRFELQWASENPSQYPLLEAEEAKWEKILALTEAYPRQAEMPQQVVAENIPQTVPAERIPQIESTPQTKNRIRETLDTISHTYNSLKDRISPQAQAALKTARESFENAWKEADRRTAGARVKMNEYINRGLESLREARANMPRGETAWMREPSMPGPSYKGESYLPGLRATASEWAQKYRKAVKDFDNRKKLKGIPEYENFLQELMNRFEVIKSALQSDPDLKRAVTTSIVPLLVRAWKSADVLIEYIDDYMKKLNSEINMFESARMTAGLQAQFQRPPKFAGLIGSGS